ncbi:DUF742 domain-containing protein [Saccharopolyspora sp. K220]|uniref:DUF742 domain-containing protein n=1 Tax=Saccharopolyspora soli TaxID=2926618 RepID=UPI001F58CD96|nr:DUF742 domain-containing protein [Saccharopolyspora soli]MCI2423605.1 DUF742 domain-containing protein [Saccharopolyspora soli]
MSPDPRERALVRPHVVTGGRAHPTRNTFDLVTLVTAARNEILGLSPEQQRVMRLCRGGALSVVEIAGRLALPISVTKVLLGDLLDSGHITTRTPRAQPDAPNLDILQEVLDGLRARL